MRNRTFSEFLNKKKKKIRGIFFYEHFSFSLTWDPVGAKTSKRIPYKPQPKVFKRLNFLPNGPHKTTFGTFKIFKIEMLTISGGFR